MIDGQLEKYILQIFYRFTVKSVLAGEGGSAVFMLLLAFGACNRTYAVAMIFLALGVNSVTMAGMNVNQLDIAPVYAGTCFIHPLLNPSYLACSY